MGKSAEWSEVELAFLWRLLKGFHTNAQIAESLGRTQRAIETKIRKLGWERVRGRPAHGALIAAESAPDGRPASPEQAWADAWKRAHGAQQYSDIKPRYEGYHITTRAYGADRMTMGGVGPYG